MCRCIVGEWLLTFLQNMANNLPSDAYRILIYSVLKTSKLAWMISFHALILCIGRVYLVMKSAKAIIVD
jgi:hypothetical protein